MQISSPHTFPFLTHYYCIFPQPSKQSYITSFIIHTEMASINTPSSTLIPQFQSTLQLKLIILFIISLFHQSFHQSFYQPLITNVSQRYLFLCLYHLGAPIALHLLTQLVFHIVIVHFYKPCHTIIIATFSQFFPLHLSILNLNSPTIYHHSFFLWLSFLPIMLLSLSNHHTSSLKQLCISFDSHFFSMNILSSCSSDLSSHSYTLIE